MKITFYKVLSYWKEEKIADFNKLSRYDSNLFELFKDKLETEELIIKSGDYDLFIFRKKSGIEDFKERPIELVAGLYAEDQFTDPEKIYILIQEQMDVFDERLEYVVDVDDSLLVSRSKIAKRDISEKNKLITGIVVMLVLLSFGMYWYVQSPVEKEPKQNVSLPIEQSIPINNIMEDERKVGESKKKVHKQSKIKDPEWRWNNFCKTYEFKKLGYCYEAYIEEKCKKKNDFKISYVEYAKQHTNIRSCRFGLEDENLKEAMKENKPISKQFFKGVKR